MGAEIRSSLEQIVLSIAGPTPRPGHLISRTAIDKTLAGRIIQTIRSDHPLGALVKSPAPPGLRIFLRALRRDGLATESLARGDAMIEGFERLLARFPRGRAGLDAAISGWMPETREQGEKTARQAGYQAMSFLLGHQSDVALNCTILVPSGDGKSIDVTYLSGQFGLRRIRAGEPLSIFGTRFYPLGGAGTLNTNPLTLDEKPLDQASCLLDEFCLPGPPKLDVVQTSDQRLFVLPAGYPEVNEPISAVIAFRRKSSWQRYATADRREEWVTMLTRCPTRTFINDCYIHEDLFPGVEPIVTTHLVGTLPLPARERGPGFPLDEVHLSVDSGWVSNDLKNIGTGDVPRHPDLMGSVFARQGLNPKQFRVHRVRMQYPVVGIAATRWLRLPEAP